MKIAIDASRANNSQKTGVENYAFFLIEELKKKVPENIQVVLYSREKLVGALAELPKNWQSKVLRWPPKRFWTQIRLSFEMISNPPDVLFVPAHVFPIIHPKKIVMTVHDIAAYRFPQSYNWFEKWYSLWSAKTATRNLWKIITPSEFTKNELLEYVNQKNLDQKIKVIAHGYDKSFKRISNKEKTKQILEKYDIEKPFIMTIGRLEQKKNTENIIKSFDILKKQNLDNYQNLKLVLAGKPGFGYQAVKTAIQNSQFKKDIIELGWVDSDGLPTLLNACSVFLFPSLYEGFGIPVLEAMACGVPTIVSESSSLFEFSKDAVAHVSAENPEQIAETINLLFTDIEYRDQKINHAYEYVENFSWEKSADQTLELLLS